MWTNKKGVMVLPKLPYIWGEGGGFTPYKKIIMKKLSIITSNVWLALRFQILLRLIKFLEAPQAGDTCSTQHI